MALRAKKWEKGADLKKIDEDLLKSQIIINETLDHIREYLVYNKVKTINSTNNRKLLVALSAMVEIMELGISTVFDIHLIEKETENNPGILEEYKTIAEKFAHTFHHLSLSIKKNAKYHSPYSLTNDIKIFKKKVEEFMLEENWSPYDEKSIRLNHILFYANKQIEKIKGLERVYKERVNADELRGKYKNLEKFFTPEHYNWNTLKEHLTFKSQTFRYALRLTITMLLGVLVGKIISLHNEYWILLTIVVILRPGYGLTQSRIKHRIIGTVIGGIIGIGTLILIQHEITLIFITIIYMMLGFWLSNRDYKIGVTFVTAYVILIYGVLTNDAENALVYRILDTLIGALLSFMATHLLWPSWEMEGVKTVLQKSINGLMHYIKEIKNYYIVKGNPTLTYKLARKTAFIENGNLMASFERMIQEPKSKQQNREELYQMSVLNQTLISAAASMGTYIQFGKTTEASVAFGHVMDKIISNLQNALVFLDADTTVTPITIENFEVSFAQLKSLRKEEVSHLPISEKEKLQRLEESQLIIDQLIWMVNLSEKMNKICQKMA